jgi:hypothetical protein
VTNEIYLNPEEVIWTLPVLERILNGVATESMRKQYVGVDLPFEIPVYTDRRFEEEMFRYVLSCRNKLRRIGSSRKLRLSCFELAALALAGRVTAKEASRVEEVLRTAGIVQLRRKLEKLRKRAKRAWIRRYGIDAFRSASDNWQRFVNWLRFRILAPPHRRQRPRVDVAVHREEREFMRNLALSMASSAGHTNELEHLADLAKAEVRRGERHPFTIRELLADKPKAQQFLAEFILKRKDPDVLRAEFQPDIMRASRLGKQFAASLTVATSDPKLQKVLAKWIEREIDPGYFDDVGEEVKYQLLNLADQHRLEVSTKAPKQIIQACKPDYNDEVDLRSFFGIWAARFLLVLQPDRNAALQVVSPAFQDAKACWQKLTPLTRQRKLDEISAGYLR